MGFRITDRIDQKARLRLDALRKSLIEDEAARYLSRMGSDDELTRRDFIDKITNITQAVERDGSAQAIAERLEESLRSDNPRCPHFQGPIEPSVVLDLL